MSSPIHIGFLARDFISWGGGIWFMQNLLRGLTSLPPGQVRITVLVPSDSTLRVRARRAASRLKQSLLHPSRARQLLLGGAAPERALWIRGVAQLRAIVPELTVFDGTDAGLMRACAVSGIQVLLPVMTPLQTNAVPWVGYLYDCQHKRRPQFFGAREIARRDSEFATMLGQAQVVFAYAQDVLTDLRTFFPEGKAELYSLPFAPLILAEELATTERESPDVRHRVAGGAPYFIICNQFWVHKDHATAFRAFAKFLRTPERSDWRLVCTGLTSDFRAPGYFAELSALLADLGIAERVIFTGYVERSLQQPLLHAAAAMVQPTLFEGTPGGGAASDAIALGVPCLLSDITVNRELQHPLATFFRAGHPESLAHAMEQVAQDPPVRPNSALLVESSHAHARQLGTTILALAEKALAS